MMISPENPVSAVGHEDLADVPRVDLVHHGGAALLANLFLRPLDHPVPLVGLGSDHLAGRGELESLLRAGFGLQFGHLARLRGQVLRKTSAPRPVIGSVEPHEPTRQPFGRAARRPLRYKTRPLMATRATILSAAPESSRFAGLRPRAPPRPGRSGRYPRARAGGACSRAPDAPSRGRGSAK